MAVLAKKNVTAEYFDSSIDVSKNKYKNNTLLVKEKLAYIMLIIVLVILAGMVISGYAILAENNYKIQELKNSIILINKESENLEMEIAELSSPSRILRIAQEELGMTLDESRIIVLSGN
ncbi:MAG: cell division protein FtsL [Vulcanibacillus sp.]